MIAAADTQAELRRDIRELGVLLGRTLVRQEGQKLLDRVEQVRALIREDRDAAAGLLARVEPIEARRLVRAFSIYIHLANVAEQVHRGRELTALHSEHGGWLAPAVDRIEAAGAPPERERDRGRPAQHGLSARSAGALYTHRVRTHGTAALGSYQPLISAFPCVQQVRLRCAS